VSDALTLTLRREGSELLDSAELLALLAEELFFLFGCVRFNASPIGLPPICNDDNDVREIMSWISSSSAAIDMMHQ
jgi:hypothetical protein